MSFSNERHDFFMCYFTLYIVKVLCLHRNRVAFTMYWFCLYVVIILRLRRNRSVFAC